MHSNNDQVHGSAQHDAGTRGTIGVRRPFKTDGQLKSGVAPIAAEKPIVGFGQMAFL